MHRWHRGEGHGLALSLVFPSPHSISISTLTSSYFPGGSRAPSPSWSPSQSHPPPLHQLQHSPRLFPKLVSSSPLPQDPPSWLRPHHRLSRVPLTPSHPPATQHQGILPQRQSYLQSCDSYCIFQKSLPWDLVLGSVSGHMTSPRGPSFQSHLMLASRLLPHCTGFSPLP